ncbi:MAG: hypothetical protein JO246_06725 [Frankiaceae bacterium]|nr:hypothetical protein [Frankiaceae bacterium]
MAMEWSERIYLARGPVGSCFMCGADAQKWLTPASTKGDYVASHIACAAKVLIAYEEWRRTGRIPERQQAWLGNSHRALLTG